MQPPPFNPQAPKKSSNFLIVAIVLGGVGLCCAGVVGLGGYGLFQGYQQVSPMIECAVGFEGVRDAIVMYAKENKGVLPPAEEWEDKVRPYYVKALEANKEDRGPFKAMAVEGPWGCRLQDNAMSGMAYNAEVAGKKLEEVPDATVVLFETERAGRNLAMPYKKLDNKNSPKIFGERRGWITVPLQGETDINPPDGGKGVKINID